MITGSIDGSECVDENGNYVKDFNGVYLTFDK